MEILTRTTGNDTPEVRHVADGAAIQRMSALARQVPVASHVSDYVARLMVATHPEDETATHLVKTYVRYGSSPRGGQALILGGKIQALLAGRYNVAFDDVRAVAPAALRHRLLLNFEGQAEGITPERVIQELLLRVPAEGTARR